MAERLTQLECDKDKQARMARTGTCLRRDGDDPAENLQIGVRQWASNSDAVVSATVNKSADLIQDNSSPDKPCPMYIFRPCNCFESPTHLQN